MSLASRLGDLITAIGADVKSIKTLDRPSYCPATAIHRWDPATSSYNNTGQTKHKIQHKLAAVAQNTAPLHIAILSDSTGVGYNGASFDKSKSIPYRMGKALGRLTGNPYIASGVGFAVGAAGLLGDVWSTPTGTWLTGTGVLTSFSAGTAVYVTPEPCTNIEFYMADYGSAGSSYTVDGGGSISITLGGTTALKPITISGLAYAIHTVVVTVPTLSIIAGQRCWTPSLNQIHIHRLATGGAKANSGSLSENFSDVTHSGGNIGLGWVAQQLLAASGISPDIAIVQIGANDIFASASAASGVQAGIENMLGYVSGAVPVLVHEIPIPTTNTAAAATVGTAYFNVADVHNCLMLDWNDYVNNPDGSYSSDGNAGADGVHPIYEHQNMIGTWIAQQLCGRQLVGEIFAGAGVIGMPGGRYKIIEQSGVWPLRPPVPAGYVDYEGPDSPADMLDGDSWDDT